MRNMRQLIASYGVVLGTNYLVVFVLLMVIYYKILRHIRKMRVTNGKYLPKYQRLAAPAPCPKPL